MVAYSSGNHAQGVAAAAELYGIAATIVMPADAPAIKIANTKSYGAGVVFYDRYGESREEIAADIMRDTGAHLIRPYDDPGIIAGQGTCALEVIQQAETALDVFVACCGGGGLSAGCALAFAALSPRTEIYIAEPADFDDFARSLEIGTRQGNDPAARSICDALLSQMPGELTFAINRRLLTAGLRVTDAEVGRAMALAFHHLKVVVEPGGAAALAAVLSGKVDISGQTAAVTLSGGNVDPDLFCETIRKAEAG